ncbi:MAG: radical SAM/SPASM domain-containing protein [Gammaproteobacteria bacterium]|nr:MAG: radical SAM/SPASM domain-containing protein [Gammaproteobacteria bacterium]
MQLEMSRVVDIEVTNRCNATCSFCPREKTPKQGFMDFEVFCKAVERIQEFDPNTKVFLTGLGEPMLHPRFLDCVKHLRANGLRPAFTTNASRLFRESSRDLLDAGLKHIDISISDLGDDYRKVYNLDYEVTRRNIADFMELNDGRCFVQVTIVKHAGNKDAIDDMMDYWRSVGVDYVRAIREINRGGSCSREYYFQGGEQYKNEAREVLEKAGLSTMCYLPFSSIFIGWNGNYYLCCMDWEKTVPVGNVIEHSIQQADELKWEFLQSPSAICNACSVNPVNDICEAMHEVDRGERGKFGVANRIKSLHASEHGEFSRAMAKAMRGGRPDAAGKK